MDPRYFGWLGKRVMLAYAGEEGMEVVAEGVLTGIDASWSETAGVWSFVTIDDHNYPLGMLMLAD